MAALLQQVCGAGGMPQHLYANSVPKNKRNSINVAPLRSAISSELKLRMKKSFYNS